MNSKRILGVVLVVIGVALLMMGMNASHSFVDQFSNAFTGHYTDHTTWYILGGTALGVVGLALTVFGPRAKSA